jgi:nucleotide-binding universal stress UspA family protein
MHKNQELLDTYLNENVTKDVNIPKRVIQGDVYPEILHETKSWKADVIVLASHRPEVSDYLLGSNAAKIVRHAPISVFVVRE